MQYRRQMRENKQILDIKKPYFRLVEEGFAISLVWTACHKAIKWNNIAERQQKMRQIQMKIHEFIGKIK